MERTNALIRGVQLLDLLAFHQKPLTFGEMRSMLGTISPPVLTRLLNQLIELGVISHHQTLYQLTPKAHHWAQAAPQNSSRDETIHEALLKLEASTQCSAIFFEIFGDCLLAKDKVPNENSPAMIEKGSWFKKNLLTPGAPFFWRQAELDMALSDPKSEIQTELTGLSTEDVLKLYEACHAQGYYIDQGQWVHGVHRMAVPIYHQAKIVGTLALGYTNVRTQHPEFTERCLDHLNKQKQIIEAHWGP